MAEDFFVSPELSKSEKYSELSKQCKALIEPETDLISNLANISAALHETFDWLWTGFYFVRGGELVLGPFQGPVACTRFSTEKGVCGSSVKQNATVIVPDVNAFPGHIACSVHSKSEIVVPIAQHGKVIAVLDVDSSELNSFDETDEKGLVGITKLLLDQHTGAW